MSITSITLPARVLVIKWNQVTWSTRVYICSTWCIEHIWVSAWNYNYYYEIAPIWHFSHRNKCQLTEIEKKEEEKDKRTEKLWLQTSKWWNGRMWNSVRDDSDNELDLGDEEDEQEGEEETLKTLTMIKKKKLPFDKRMFCP